MENALNLDTVRLADNKKEIVILDQTLLPNQCKYLRYLGGDLFSSSTRRSGYRCDRWLCLLCAGRSD